MAKVLIRGLWRSCCSKTVVSDEEETPFGVIINKEWARIQWEDLTLRLIFKLVEGSTTEPGERSPDSRMMRRELPNLCL